jgi:hypothetical protein
MTVKEAKAVVDRAQQEVEKERDRINAAKNESEAALKKVFASDPESGDFHRLLEAREAAESRFDAHRLRLHHLEDVVLVRAREEHAKRDLESKRAATKEAMIALAKKSEELDALAGRFRSQITAEVMKLREKYDAMIAAWAALPIADRDLYPHPNFVTRWSAVRLPGYGVDILADAAAASSAQPITHDWDKVPQ